MGVMGDHAKVASMSTFTAKKFEAHPEEIANLVGARFVTASETEHGHAWATARIKELTGGDPISTRRMYKDRFTFLPQFKLGFAGNHAPNFGTVDNAIRRRLIVIPFDHTPEHPDLELEERLRFEWPGILRWMINGCLEWKQVGLQVPETLQAATSNHLAVQDTFAEWVEVCCEITTDDVCTSSTDLFGSWCAFAKDRGEHPGNFSGLAERMKRATGKGPVQIKRLRGKGYRGVRLKG